MEEQNAIANHLVDQFESVWNMLKASIENVPDEKWSVGLDAITKPWNQTKGENVWYFSERVFHIIETVEFYGNDDPKVMKWGARIGGIKWKEESPEETAARITKKEMLTYLEETKQQLKEKLHSLSYGDMVKTDGFSEWQPSRLAKILYTMRHSMWHIGELSRAIREYDCERIHWQ
ncbi:MAG: DinB family protein [Candidatus Thorarchaeota archaeon]|nr:DinB family protein [Candidatus Thorarchaeota archaeon]